MNWSGYNNKISGFLKWGLAVYLVLNTALLAYLWIQMSQRPDMHKFPEGPNKKDFGHAMAKDLNLTEDQQIKFRQLEQENFKMIDSLSEQVPQLRMEIANELFKAKPDQNLINNNIHKIGLITENVERQITDNLRKLNGLCTPEQIEKLKGVFERQGFRHGPEGPGMRRPGPNEPNKRDFPPPPSTGD